MQRSGRWPASTATRHLPLDQAPSAIRLRSAPSIGIAIFVASARSTPVGRAKTPRLPHPSRPEWSAVRCAGSGAPERARPAHRDQASCVHSWRHPHEQGGTAVSARHGVADHDARAATSGLGPAARRETRSTEALGRCPATRPKLPRVPNSELRADRHPGTLAHRSRLRAMIPGRCAAGDHPAARAQGEHTGSALDTRALSRCSVGA
jgi:hypothetical protein